jgi:hypothetical protein
MRKFYLTRFIQKSNAQIILYINTVKPVLIPLTNEIRTIFMRGIINSGFFYELVQFWRGELIRGYLNEIGYKKFFES